jgi:anaerobic dimethyl sulfoxide reductase subunit B (iron-sulfur subunit)
MDTDRCIGCNSCIAACLDWNNIMPGQGVQWRRMFNIESGEFPNTRLVNLSLACMHCAKPACKAICPVDAIEKRPEDGIVLVDKDKCIGCHSCFSACPLGVPQYGDDGTMQKCNLCLDRLAEGQQPACVDSCPSGALCSGTFEELSKRAQERAARKLAWATQR